MAPNSGFPSPARGGLYHVGVTTPHRERASELLGETHVVDVGEATNGQADTVKRMVELLRLDGPVLVLNCDNVHLSDLSRLEAAALEEAEVVAALLVHPSTDPACSYVNRLVHPDKFVEKPTVPPSEWALSGAYWFRSARELHRATIVARTLSRGGELYLSHVLNYLHGEKVTVPTEADKVMDWGDPSKLAGYGAEAV